MSESKDKAKAGKKATKAAIKQQKKSAGPPGTHASIDDQPSRPEATSTQGNAALPTPAERSAFAAERQVRLQKLRVLLALAALLVAIGTFLLTTKPWKTDSDAAQPDAATTTRPIP